MCSNRKCEEDHIHLGIETGPVLFEQSVMQYPLNIKFKFFFSFTIVIFFLMHCIYGTNIRCVEENLNSMLNKLHHIESNAGCGGC